MGQYSKFALQKDDQGLMAGVEAALEPALKAIDSGHHKLKVDPKYNFLLKFSAAWVYTSMATIGVSILEKQKRHSDACELLRKLLGEQSFTNEVKRESQAGIGSQSFQTLMSPIRCRRPLAFQIPSQMQCGRRMYCIYRNTPKAAFTDN